MPYGFPKLQSTTVVAIFFGGVQGSATIVSFLAPSTTQQQTQQRFPVCFNRFDFADAQHLRVASLLKCSRIEVHGSDFEWSD